MYLKKLKLTNFRYYKKEIIVDLDGLVVFVGRNDSGKSSLFNALDIFFEGKSAPDKDVACVHADDATIRIACVFDEVPPELILPPKNVSLGYVTQFTQGGRHDEINASALYARIQAGSRTAGRVRSESSYGSQDAGSG